MSSGSWVWMSHVNEPSTPCYGGDTGISISPVKRQDCGDSCNTVELKISNHSGTHIDAPLHFIPGGKTIEQYEAEDWIFRQPVLLDIDITDDTIIDCKIIEKSITPDINDADIVLIRTGMEAFRSREKYWKHAPGFSPDLFRFFQTSFPSFRAIGMDTISISSLTHRTTGREAHKEFLGNGIIIMEDLSLAGIPRDIVLDQVIALPYRYINSDGSPITVIGKLKGR